MTVVALVSGAVSIPVAITAAEPTDAATTALSTAFATGTVAVSGSTAASAAAPGGAKTGTSHAGDTITWVVSYENRTTGTAHADLRDTLGDAGAYVAGSLRLPASPDQESPLTPQYSADGGTTWLAGTPPASAVGVGFTGSFPQGTQQRSANPTTETVSPAQYYCGSGAAGFSSWDRLSISGAPAGSYTTARVSITDVHGDPVAGFTDVPLAPGATLDLSAIPVAAPTSTLTAQIAYESATAAAADARVTISWVGAPVQLCFQTTAPPVVCGQADDVSNSATVVTEAAAGTDAPGGNPTGTVRFSNSPAADACSLDIAETPSPPAAGAGESVCAPGSTDPGCAPLGPLNWLTLVKSVQPHPDLIVGDTITYDFELTNTGRQPLENVTVTDEQQPPAGPLDGPVDCPLQRLGSGRTMTCTATYTVTQADVDHGSISDTAVAHGAPPSTGGIQIDSDPSSVTVPIPVDGSLTITKSANVNVVDQVGDIIRYTYLVYNSGTQSLDDIAVEDQFAPPGGPAVTVTCPQPTLAPGASETCRASDYAVTQADVDNGFVENSAIASGVMKTGPVVTSPPSVITVPVVNISSIGLVKSAAPAHVSTAGEVITYSFLVTNTGNRPLADVRVTDAQFAPAGVLDGPIVCPATELALGASMTCTATYTVSQADIDNGSVNDAAVAHGTPPSGPEKDSPVSQVSVPVAATAAIAVHKSADVAAVNQAGDVVHYTFVVTNTGSEPLTEVAVTDQLSAPAGPELTVTCPTDTLAVAESMTCSGSPYTVTQADVDHGSVDNTASATGTPPGGPAVVSPPSAASVLIPRVDAIAVVKSATPQEVFRPGDVVTYTFAVVNTGNQQLTGVNVTDTQAAPAGGLDGPVSCPQTTLAPRAGMACTATYTVTQADVDHGSVNDTAVAHGTPPTGPAIDSPPSHASVAIPATGTLTVVKHADVPRVDAAGDVIHYTFTVTNSGNVTLSDVSVSDQLAAPAGPEVAVTCPEPTLGPGASETCTATPYTVTQADVDKGSVDNEATASGLPANGPSVVSAPSALSVPVTTAASVSLVKSSDVTIADEAGDLIAYSYLVTNTGNVTLSGIAVDDAFSGPAGPAVTVTCPVGTLAPAESTTCTSSPYTVTQADVDFGSVDNTATATGIPPVGSAVTSPVSAVSVAIPPVSGLSLVKYAEPTQASAAGDVITYSFWVINVGNQTLTNLDVTDEQAPPASGLDGPIECPQTTIAPRALVICTATYTVTQADADARTVNDTAVAHATPPTGPSVDSPPSSVSVPIPAAPGITIVKSADVTVADRPGDVVNYSYLVTNTGNVTLAAIAVTDQFTAPAGPAVTVACPEPDLAPGQSETCTATPYTVTQADVDAGSIVNSAIATGTTPTTAIATSEPSLVSVAIPAETALTLVKSAAPPEVHDAGDVIAYSFLVTNTGNQTLSDVTVTDEQAPPAGALDDAIVCPQTVLAQGESTTCTASYTVTQADVDHGSVTDTAIAHGTPPSGTVIDSPPATATVPIPDGAALTVVKSSDVPVVDRPGDIVNYSYLVTNTGNTTLSDVAVDDVFTAPAGPAVAVACPQPTLGPGESETCTASPYTVTVADLGHGSVENSAIATAVRPQGGTVSSPPSVVVVEVPELSALRLVKSASPTFASDVGDVIAYTFAIVNTGNQPVTDVGVTDTQDAPAGDLDGPIVCSATTLEPLTATTCTATYTVTQADVDNGSVNDTAVAHGTPPSGPVVDSPPSAASVPIAAGPSITVEKSSDVQAAETAGDIVNYSFLVTNTGNVTLSQITVDDQFAPPAGPAITVTCPEPSLAPGQSETCTGSPYTVTLSDVNNGRVENSATASGTPPTGDAVTSPPSLVTVEIPPVESIALVKYASPTQVSSVGDVITFSFWVINNGNQTLTDIAVTDEQAPPAGDLDGPIVCPQTTLAPRTLTICTADYTVTQQDIDNGSVNDTAVAHGLPPSGTVVHSLPSSDSVPTAGAPAISVVKSSDVTTVRRAGDTINYSYLVTNTGNQTLGDIAVIDVFTSPSGPTVTVTCPQPSLAPAEQETCTASPYTVTQTDVGFGSVDNLATAQGTSPSSVVVVSPASQVAVEIPPVASLALVKSASPTQAHRAGDVVTYTFRILNTGNQPLTDVNVTDAQAPPAGGLDGPVSCPQTTLAPGELIACTADYTVTQTDVDHGSVDDVAVAHGTPPSGTVKDSQPSSVSVKIPASPAITVVKSSDVTEVHAAGDRIHYSFLVTNSGNVRLTDIEVTDLFSAPAGPQLPVLCPQPALAPGESETCTAGPYTVTQADVEHGSVDNQAYASGIPPSGGIKTVSALSLVSVRIPPVASLALVKSASPPQVHAAGDVIAYSFQVVNDGNQTLTEVNVTDVQAAPAGDLGPIACPQATLAPGEATTCTAEYAVTQTDVDSGAVTDIARAHGTPLSGPVVDSPPSAVAVPIPAGPALTIVKHADPLVVHRAGDQIAYSFTVTNVGNVNLGGIAVNDQPEAPAGPAVVVTCPQPTLAPGQSEVCTASPYTVTQDDVDNARVRNTATASGTPPTGPAVTSAPSTSTVLIPPVAGIALVKSASPSQVHNAGEVIAYSFVVTNTGNRTLTGVSVTDAQAVPAGGLDGPITCPDSTLDPAASMTCTAAYTVSQTDADHGSVNDTAVAHGSPPAGAAVDSLPSSVSVPIPAAASIKVVKTADVSIADRAGDQVNYSYAVTNTGNVSLSAITIDDQLSAPAGPAVTITCPESGLDPGESETCTASPYTVTQADVDHGRIDNQATASGTPPSGPVTTSPPSSVTVQIPSVHSLSVVKHALPTVLTNAGVKVAYSFFVRNTGNRQLTGIAVTDVQDAPAGALDGPVTCAQTTLAPLAATTCSASYTVTPADVDNGVVTDTATAHGMPESGPAVASPPSSAAVVIPATPGITIEKSADVTAAHRPGDVIHYSFRVTNTGNVSLSDVTVFDQLFAPAGPEIDVTCPQATLASGESETCTGTPYVVTQADVDHGRIDNAANAAALPPAGDPVAISTRATLSVPIPPVDAITVVKTATPAVVTAAGESIAYSFLVTNTGNRTLTDVRVTDAQHASAGALDGPVVCPETTLGAGASTTCTASYTATQADIDRGSISDTATAHGTPPSGPTVDSADSSATVEVTPDNSITVLKQADLAVVDRVGDHINYSFVVTNTGHQTLSAITVTDVFTPPAGPELIVTCPQAQLAPGQSETCTAPTYVTTQADIDNDLITNTATASGLSPTGADVVSEPSELVMPVTLPPIGLERTASPSEVTHAGEQIVYSFVVTNLGDVPLDEITVHHQFLAPAGPPLTVTCPELILQPGASATCTSSPYTVTQADVDHGSIDSISIASGLPPSRQPLTSALGGTKVSIADANRLTVEKSSTTADVTRVGQQVEYTFVATNRGNQTLSDVSIVDTVHAPSDPSHLTEPQCVSLSVPDAACSGTTATLAPGQSATFTATYTVTEADLESASLTDTAVAHGTTPSDSPAPAGIPSTWSVPVRLPTVPSSALPIVSG